MDDFICSGLRDTPQRQCAKKARKTGKKDQHVLCRHTQNNGNKENKVHATKAEGLKITHEHVDQNVAYSILD